MRKMLDFFTSFSMVTVLIIALAAPASDAQDSRPSSLEGNWSVEWHDYPEKGQVTRTVAVFARQWDLNCVKLEGNACRNEYQPRTDGIWSVYYYSVEHKAWGSGTPRVDQSGHVVDQSGHVNIGWDEHSYNLSGRRSELAQIGPNEIRGRWSRNEKGGTEVWRRALPTVTRLILRSIIYGPVSESKVESETVIGRAPGRIQGRYDSNWGADNKTFDRPRFIVEISGENLWGHHLIDFGGAVGLNLIYRHYILKDGRRQGHMTSRLNPAEVTGVELKVAIWPEIRPGKKEVRLDGIPIPFELVIKGYPGETVKTPGTAAKAADAKAPSTAAKVADAKSAYGAADNALP